MTFNLNNITSRVNDYYKFLIQKNDSNNDRRYGGFKGVTILLKKDEPDKGDVTRCPEHGYSLHDILGNVQSGYLNVCSVCMCLCDDYNDKATARTFSLKKVETNIVENL